jgi:hypothetical protein
MSKNYQKIAFLYILKYIDYPRIITASITLGIIFILSLIGIVSHKIILKSEFFNSAKKKVCNCSLSELIFSDENEPKLILLTQFNTLVNKLMPEKVGDYVRATYEKIYGKERIDLYSNVGKTESNYNKRSKKKKTSVTFKDYVEEREFVI